MAATKLLIEIWDREVQRIGLDTNLRRESALQKKKKLLLIKHRTVEVAVRRSLRRATGINWHTQMVPSCTNQWRDRKNRGRLQNFRPFFLTFYVMPMQRPAHTRATTKWRRSFRAADYGFKKAIESSYMLIKKNFYKNSLKNQLNFSALDCGIFISFESFGFYHIEAIWSIGMILPNSFFCMPLIP
jgi:hypothetical protein